jgi:Predicted transcriptional regulator containing an HTH domain and an uncharacterized domain shared with the mammalian protein Schlafen
MDFVESKLVELKETIVDDIKKEVIAFINSEGGNLYVGVADDGRVMGLDDPQSDMLRLTNMIRDSIKPDATMFVECQIEHIDEKDIIRVQVQKGTHAPYYLIGKGIRPEGVFVRQGTSSVPASEDAIRRMIKESDGDCFETMRSLNQDLSFETLTEEYNSRDIMLGAPQMVSLGIKTPDGVYTNLGLLLSDQCTHTIKTALFSGVKKEQFQDRKEFSGSILQQMNDAYAFIDLNNKKKSTFSGLHRMDQRDYPETAVREALLNSLVHREYSFSSSTLISIFSDRIEFVSLGGLIKGLTLKDIMLGISQCRNEKLAAVFYRLQLIEAYGTGIPKIIESYEGDSCQPKIESSDNAFKITLPNRNQDVAYLPETTKSERAVLAFAGEKRKLQRIDVEEKLGVSRSRANHILKQLLDKGMLKPVGNGRNRQYIISK